jgi:HEAT repeat protein
MGRGDSAQERSLKDMRSRMDIEGLLDVFANSADREDRIAAAVYLGQIGGECYATGVESRVAEVDLIRAEEVFTAALNDPDERIRGEAKWAVENVQKGLRGLQGSTLYAEHRAATTSGSLQSIAYQAGLAYNASGRAPTVPAELRDKLLEGLRSEDEVTRRWAAVALGSFRHDQQVGGALERALEDRDANVRDCAAFSLAEVMGEGARATLQMALAKETSGYIRDRIKAALNRIGGRSS